MSYIDDDRDEYRIFYNKLLPIVVVSSDEQWLDYGDHYEQYLYDGNSYRSTNRIFKKAVR